MFLLLMGCAYYRTRGNEIGRKLEIILYDKVAGESWGSQQQEMEQGIVYTNYYFKDVKTLMNEGERLPNTMIIERKMKETLNLFYLAE